jgi:hypothetical protein
MMFTCLLLINVFRHCNKKFVDPICAAQRFRWRISVSLCEAYWCLPNTESKTENYRAKLLERFCSFPQATRASNIIEFTTSSIYFSKLTVLKYSVVPATEAGETLTNCVPWYEVIGCWRRCWKWLLATLRCRPTFLSWNFRYYAPNNF